MAAAQAHTAGASHRSVRAYYRMPASGAAAHRGSRLQRSSDESGGRLTCGALASAVESPAGATATAVRGTSRSMSSTTSSALAWVSPRGRPAASDCLTCNAVVRQPRRAQRSRRPARHTGSSGRRSIPPRRPYRPRRCAGVPPDLTLERQLGRLARTVRTRDLNATCVCVRVARASLHPLEGAPAGLGWRHRECVRCRPTVAEDARDAFRTSSRRCSLLSMTTPPRALPPLRRERQMNLSTFPRDTMDVDQKLSMSLDELVTTEGEGGGRSRGQKRRGPPDGQPATIRVGRRVYVGNLSWKTSWQVRPPVLSSMFAGAPAVSGTRRVRRRDLPPHAT